MRVVFIHPLLLFGLLAIPVLLGFIYLTERRRTEQLNRIGEPALIADLMQSISRSQRYWKQGLWLMTVAMLVIAFARPTWGVRTDLIETQGASVFVILDVSSSMDAEDIPPSRLQRAKIDIYDLLDGIAGNEVGLIAFAGTSFVVFPLTTDAQSAKTFVDYLTTNTISRQGTAVGAAIQLALDSFDSERATEKIIVLMSDGEDHTVETDIAIQAAIDAGVTVHTLGYGTEGGGSIPIRNSAGQVVGNKQDRTGNIVISTLNASLLMDIARETDGIYQSARTNENVIPNLVSVINAAERGYLGEDEQTRGVERFGFFVALALVLLSLEMLIPETKST
jgi:Ca-activated chloride channel family protein